MQKATEDLFLKSYISFCFKGNCLQVEMETKRLYIHSYKENDFENCVSLYGNKSITKYFDHGDPRSRNEVASLVRERGNRHFINGEPFGLFSIFRKEDMAFLGQIDLLPSYDYGVAEIGFILNDRYHNQGYCTEAVKAFLFDYVEELNYRNFNCFHLPVTKIIGTVHPENLSSKKIFIKMGMKFDKLETRFGNPRLWYSIQTSSIIENQKIGLL